MRYDPIIDPYDPNSSHSLLIRLVEPGTNVLDVGCASGYLGRILISRRGCTVSGIEIDLRLLR